MIRLLVSIFLCIILASEGTVSSGSAPRFLRLATPIQDLKSAYGLAVTALPDPPAELLEDRAAVQSQCPVEVRAIIMGDSRDTTFTVVGLNDQSILLAEGEGTRTDDGWIAVSMIASDFVVIRRGAEAFRCPFYLGGGSAASTRQDSER